MASQVYFGNANKQTWIKSPSSGMNASSKGWGATTELLNGRASVAKSNGSHRVLNPSWVGSLNANDLSESLQTIKDFSDGIYGDGPFYWIDPFAAATNILPPHWAAPILTQKDWPSLAPGVEMTVSSFESDSSFPKAVSYHITSAYESTNKLTIIIPSGYKLHFGWHGLRGFSSGYGVRIVPYLRSTGQADTALNPLQLSTDSTIRTNTQVNGTTYSKVEIFIALSSPLNSSENISIAGMIAQVLPATSSVASGGFISGRGTTALEFSSKPTIEYYSSNINNGQIGMSAEWTEV